MEDYAAGGKSLAKVDGKVIFIENVVPGDVVDVRLMKNKKDWAEGVPIHTHSLSVDRVTPFFALILVFAAVVNGKCCLTKSSYNTNISK